MIVHIINADDYGKDEMTTDAIMHCFHDGSVTHATCMVNMPYCAEAMRIAKENGVLDRIGLHINLTEGFPLTNDIKRIPMFCDNEGQFNGARYRRKLMMRFMLPREARGAVEREVAAQVRRFIDFGGVLMHADSHHHVHFDWSVGNTVVPVLKKMGFRTVRISYNAGCGRSIMIMAYRKIYNSWLGGRMGVRSNWFCSYSGYLDEEPRWIKRNGIVEVMVHPMIVDGVVRDGVNGATSCEWKSNLL